MQALLYAKPSNATVLARTTMNAGEQLLSALGDGKGDPLAAIKQQAMMKVRYLSVAAQ